VWKIVMNESIRATRYLILACAMWGLSFPAGKALIMVQGNSAAGHDSWFYSAVGMVARFALAAVIILLLCKKRRPTREELYQGAGVAFFGGVGMLFQLDGLAHTDASVSAFLTQGSVIFIPLVAALIQNKVLRAFEIMCIALAVAGVAVLSGFDPQKMHLGRGEAETLISALFFTGHIMWLERPRFAKNDSLTVSWIMFILVALICLPVVLLSGPGVQAAITSISSPSAWVFLGILIGPCTLLAFLLMNHWQRHISATKAGLIYCLEPVFASILALFLPAWFSSLAGLQYANETLTTRLILGGGLVMTANILMQLGSKPGLMNERQV
jgi:drug/metabolite transporter (DMT)-like permease